MFILPCPQFHAPYQDLVIVSISQLSSVTILTFVSTLQETQKTNTLSCFTEGTIQVIKRLACLSRDDIDCIKTFLECKTLVDWLKENVKGSYICITTKKILSKLFYEQLSEMMCHYLHLDATSNDPTVAQRNETCDQIGNIGSSSHVLG